jgi:hypothetical protein
MFTFEMWWMEAKFEVRGMIFESIGGLSDLD